MTLEQIETILARRKAARNAGDSALVAECNAALQRASYIEAAVPEATETTVAARPARKSPVRAHNAQSKR